MPRRNSAPAARGMHRGPKLSKSKRDRLKRAHLTPLHLHTSKRPGGNRGRA